MPLPSFSQHDSKRTGALLSHTLIGSLGCALVVALSGCQKIEAGYCDARLPASKVTIELEAPAYTLSTSADARYLGEQHGHDGEMITYGLTSARSSVRAEVNLHVMRLPGAVCARPDITLHMAYKPMTVEIAHELGAHSCAYETVLGHEKKHVDAFAAQLASSKATLASEIAAHGVSRAVLYSSPEAAEHAMQLLEDNWLVPRADELLAEVEQRQRAVDSPAEYQRVGAACPDSALLSGKAAPDAFHF